MNLLYHFIKGWRNRSFPRSIPALLAARATYSHYGEDAVVRAIFGPSYGPGLYIDVGCFHPIKRSNTYVFYLLGWRGLGIDPNPDFTALWSKYRPRDQFINIAISEHEGKVYYISNFKSPGENRISFERADCSEFMDTKIIDAVTLSSIISKFFPSSKTIDLMSIDCEGHDLSVLKSNDFNRYRPRVLILEDKGEIGATELHRYCESLDYKLVGVCKVSRIYQDQRWKRTKNRETRSEPPATISNR